MDMETSERFLEEVDVFCQRSQMEVADRKELGDGLIMAMEMNTDSEPVGPCIFFDSKKWQVNPVILEEDEDIGYAVGTQRERWIHSLFWDEIGCHTLKKAEDFVHNCMESPVGLQFHASTTAA